VDLTVPPRGQQASRSTAAYLTPQRLQKRNVVTPYLRPQGQVNRKVICRGCGLGRSEEANAVL
jgi:hypothetical protein